MPASSSTSCGFVFPPAQPMRECRLDTKDVECEVCKEGATASLTRMLPEDGERIGSSSCRFHWWHSHISSCRLQWWHSHISSCRLQWWYSHISPLRLTHSKHQASTICQDLVSQQVRADCHKRNCLQHAHQGVSPHGRSYLSTASAGTCSTHGKQTTDISPKLHVKRASWVQRPCYCINHERHQACRHNNHISTTPLLLLTAWALSLLEWCATQWA
jgi:hypothetical protein